MNSNNWFKSAMCLVTAGLAVAAGCANDKGEGAAAIRTPDYAQTAPSETWRGPKAEPAPAPPPPAPVIEKCAMAFPTGDMASSAILVRKNLPAEVVAGQPFDYEIVVQNLTNGSLDNVVLTDNMSNNFKLNASNPQADATGSMIKWNLGTLAPRASKTIKANGTASGGVGTISGCAAVTYANSLCCNINVVQPALKLVKTQPADANLCDAIPVKLVVTNTGSGPARNVKVTDNLPAGLTTSDGKTNLSFDAGTLGAGQSREFNFMAKAGKNGSYSNTATASADGGLSASAQAGTTFRQPVLAVKAECPGTNLIGRELTFKYTVTNSGDMACSSTTLNASVPGSFVSADGGGSGAGGNVSWNVGNLGPNESKTFTVKVRAGGAGTLNTSVTARCTSCSCCPEAKAQCSVNITGSPDIGTLLTDADGVIFVGDNHTYTYEVQNQGQVDLTNVKVVVTLPEGVDYVSSTAPKAPVIEGRKLTFTGVTGVLKPGDRPSFTLVLKSKTAGEKLVVSETTADQLKTPVRDDELTFFVDR